MLRGAVTKTVAAFRKDKRSSCGESVSRREKSLRAAEFRQPAERSNISARTSEQTLPEQRSKAAANSKLAGETSRRARRFWRGPHVRPQPHAKKIRGKRPQLP